MGGAHEQADKNHTDDDFPNVMPCKPDPRLLHAGRTWAFDRATLADWESILVRPPDNNDPDSFEGKFNGSCHCQAVQFKCKADPEASICCHCSTCQVVHGATSQRALIFKKENIAFTTASIEHLAFYQVSISLSSVWSGGDQNRS